VATTTVAAIRDRMITLVQALTPTTLASVRFKADRAEINAFRDWAEASPQAAFRRFAVMDTGDSEPADVSNTDVERRVVTFEAVVAYPHSYRYGTDGSRDRLDVMELDQHQLEDTIGMRGYGNFTSDNADCSWLREGSMTTREDGGAVSFLVFRLAYSYHRSV
jgi:hypothetical protein